MKKVEFIKAAPKDATLLAATRQKAWAATYRGIYPDDMIDNFDYPWHIQREERNLQNPCIHTYLIMDGEACGGYFTYFIKVRLFSLYLLPDLQDRGLGRAVFEFVKSRCQEAGFDKLYLSCSPQNTRALSFYQHMGCKIVHEDLGHQNPEEDTVELEFICESFTKMRKYI